MQLNPKQLRKQQIIFSRLKTKNISQREMHLQLAALYRGHRSRDSEKPIPKTYIEFLNKLEERKIAISNAN